MLCDHPTDARLADILLRARCSNPRCAGLTPQVDAHIGFVSVSVHEKPIGVQGRNVYKVGMV